MTIEAAAPDTLTTGEPDLATEPILAGEAIQAASGAVLAGEAVLADAEAIVALMRRLAAKVAREGATGWAPALRREVLTRVGAAISGLGTVRGAVLVAEKTSAQWKGTGAGSFDTWAAAQSGQTKRATSREVRHAEQLDAVPDVAEQVVTGAIGPEHARIIAALAATGTPRQRAAVVSPAGQAHLLALARAQNADVFARSVAHWAATIDPDGLERDHEAQRTRRYFHLTEATDGTAVKGFLDTDAGRTLALALEALTPPPPDGDDRDFGQRQADALDTMARTILSLDTTKPGAHVPPQVSFLLTEATWLAATNELDRRRASLRTFGLPLDDEAVCEHVASYPPATWEDGTPVPFTVVAAALCDCEVTRIVLDTEGLPVNLGRTQRLYTGAHRRAVIARDRHCSWPGCTLNARWCQVHHRISWDRDHGETSLDVGVLLCNFHHHETHRRDLTITRHPTTGPPNNNSIALVRYEFRDPTGRLIQPIGHNPDPHPASHPANHRADHPADASRSDPPDELDLTG